MPPLDAALHLMQDVLLELIKLASVGLIAGLFSSAIANRDHRQRKWWELRVAAYQSAIEALSDLVHYYEKQYSAAVEGRDLPDDIEKKLSSSWEIAYAKVRKSSDSGAFLFSSKANAALQEFMKEDDFDWYVEGLDNSSAKARKCLSILVECSKEDLKLRRRLFERVF